MSHSQPFFLSHRLQCVLLTLVLGGCHQSGTLIDPNSSVDGSATLVPGDSENVAHTSVRFNDVIAKAGDKPVIVDFWASWCKPCVMQGAELEKVARVLGEKAIVVKVNVDDEPELARHFQVTSIPDVRVFRDGKGIHRLVGFHQAGDIIARVE